MFKLVFCLIILFSPYFALGQEDTSEIKRFRISIDIGFPNLAGLNGEYIIPSPSNHFSINSDISYLPNIIPNTKTILKYYSIGSNYYFGKNAKGLYLGLGAGKLPIKTTQIEGNDADISVNFSMLNSKIGLKIGSNAFFKLELGYSMVFYDIDEANEYLNKTYGIQINSSLNFLQLMNGKIGFGFSF
jgi:hypothetical protein